MITFIHSGDAGDVIYSLPVMLAKTQGQPFNLILGTKVPVRKNFDEEWAENILSLIRIQPYIAAAWRQKDGDSWNYDCDPFRQRMFKAWKKGKSAMEYTAETLAVPFSSVPQQHPWITVDEPMHVDGCPVVVNRTFRYHNPRFPWKKALQKYAGQMVFVGFQAEWERFVMEYGTELPFCPTENVLQLARLLGGCRLFIGNQSLAQAIAEGMKLKLVMEVSPLYPTCLFPRDGSWLGHDHRVVLPEIP